VERQALSDTAAPADLVEVRLLELSLTDFAHSSAHHDELFREFALVLSCEPAPSHELPGRVLAVIEELTERFGGFTAAPQGELQAALERGDATIDLTFHVPAQAKDAALRLGELLAAADRYCREGELLTVAPPPEAVRFRDWYLHEFVAQIDGESPTPWPACRG
jgi:hypothetical protein